MDEKWCNKCKAHLPVEAFFNATTRDGLSPYCAEHERQRVKEWNRKRRQKFIADMGGKCVDCGYSKDYRALQVDHINSDGAEERAEKGFRHDSNAWYAHVLSHPDRYQLLCANCNTIKKSEKDEMTGPKTVRNKPTHRFAPERLMAKFKEVPYAR